MNNYKKKYEEYIHSSKWQEKRRQKAEQQKYRCEKCDKFVPNGFHIHHITYENFGNEKMEDLQFLCEDCHINVHCKIKAFVNNKKKPKKDRKSCQNCFYSQLMKFKGKNSRTVLYCNKRLMECEDICRQYRKGPFKKIPTTKIKKKKK